MARQQVNIGVEGNDGTGDSIRESFRKVNENFQELYAVFGIGGSIDFLDLGDTPQNYTNKGGDIVAVKQDEQGLETLELVSDGELSGNSQDDTIQFDRSVEGKLVVFTTFSEVSQDSAPALGGHMDANGFAIGKVAVTESAAQSLSAKFQESFTVEDLVINKRFAGQNYLKREVPGISANLRSEPADAANYTFNISSFSGTNVTIPGHGLDSGSDGAAYRYNSTGSDATGLTSGNVYFARIIDENNLSLHQSQSDALGNTDPITVTGGSGTQVLVDNAYDNQLMGFWLDNEALPRKSVVRRQGDIMEGALTLHDHPGDLSGAGTPAGSDDLQAATKYYVDQNAFSSTINLYVNTQGDDLQLLTPPGSEGRSLKNAFASVNKACEKAEEIQVSSPFEAGPYMQTVTHSDGSVNTVTSSVGIQNVVPGREPVKTLLEANREFIQEETVAFVDQQYPNFEYDRETCYRDVGLIIDSVILDTLSGNNANYLSRWAGIRYYSSPSARKAVTTQLTQTIAGIQKARDLALIVLENDAGAAPYDPIQDDIDQTFLPGETPDALASASVQEKFDLVVTTIQSGPLDAPNIVDGSVYELNISNGNTGFVDQGNPSNTDLIPGKLVIGKQSKAKGIIINYNYESDTSTSTPVGNDTLELQLVEPIEFLPGEEIEFGNSVRIGQITILVEAGIYEEDYPIKVPDNVSIKGDEFRRTIIRPKNRSSQSRYADTYFYRDREFDGLTGDSDSVTGFPDTNLPVSGTEYRNPLTGDVDGYFGYHYLVDPTSPLNLSSFGTTSVNNNRYTDASKLINLNRDFIIEEVIQYIDETYPSLSYNEAKYRRDTGQAVDSLVSDLENGGREKSLESQFAYYIDSALGQESETQDAIQYIKTIAASVLANTNFSAKRGSVDQVIDVSLSAETNSNTALNALVDLIAFAFENQYNPARNNTELDVLLMNDSTRISNLTMQGHGGFMCVLDPNGQVLTKSPYIQVGSSFSQSLNRQAFRGGMFVDAFCGNIPTTVISKDSDFEIRVKSKDNEGLFFKQPQTPAPFYIDGERFQVNAVREYDPATGTAKLFLDTSSNRGNGFSGSTNTLLNVDLDITSVEFDASLIVGNQIITGSSHGFVNGDQILYDNQDNSTVGGLENEGRYFVSVVDSVTLELFSDSNLNNQVSVTAGSGNHSLARILDITVQTGGNRSMLGNDFTQINDLGYGLITTNGGLSEMVSMFTYYTQASFYAKNGGEIRSLNGSNGYGNFGLVAEGADPNEIPDSVSLRDNMLMPMKTFQSEVTLVFGNSTGISLNQGDVLTTSDSSGTGTVSFAVEGAEYSLVYLKDVIGNFDTSTDVVTTGSGTISGSAQPTEVSTSALTNREEQLSIYVYDGEHEVQNRGEFEIYHSTAAPGVFGRYEVANVSKQQSFVVDGHVIDLDNLGVNPGSGAKITIGGTRNRGYVVYSIEGGENYGVGQEITIPGTKLGGASPANDLVLEIADVDSGTGQILDVNESSLSGTPAVNSSTPYFDGQVYRLNFSTGGGDFSNDGLITDLEQDVLGIYRQNGVFIFEDVAEVDRLVTRPSTAVQFDESKETTYRTITFSDNTTQGTSLADNTVLAGFDINYDYVRLVVDSENISNTTAAYINGGTSLGANTGDRAIAVLPVGQQDDRDRLDNGDMIFVWDGKSYIIDSYLRTSVTDDENFDVIQISDLANSDINIPPTGTGLSSPVLRGTNTITLRVGLQAAESATITINISTCRATGHDFLDIGTGGFNTSNYPNVLFGEPAKELAASYQDSNDAVSGQVWERSKGRVFWVSTDQDGFFRVGKFFTVDQGTGTVTFAASIALSNLDGIGFKRGVTVAEFSTDTGMTNNAPDTVPVQSAVRGYVNRRLGFDHNGNTVAELIGPGAVPLDGSRALSGNLNMSSNGIVNLAAPTSNSDAANKGYVDDRVGEFRRFDDLDNTLIDESSGTVPEPDSGQLLIMTGAKRLVVLADDISNGEFTVGDSFSASVNGGTGTILQVVEKLDPLLGNINIIVYNDTSDPGDFIDTSDTIAVTSGPSAPVTLAPVDEIANGIESVDNEIALTVARSETDAELALTYKPGSIENVDVASDASISQSKLDMSAATTRASAAGITQANLGLASFDSTNFESTNGWVAIKDNGIGFDKISQIGNNRALGRVSGSSGDIQEIQITTIGEGDSLVRTQSNGEIRIESLILGGSNDNVILSLDSSTLRITTPGGATVLTAVGTDANDIVNTVPGNLTIEKSLSIDEDLTVTQNSQFNGNVDLGNSTSDTVTVTGRVDSAVTPNQSNSHDLGSSSLRWQDVYGVNGNFSNTLTVGGATTLNGNVTLGNGTGDNIVFSGEVDSNIIPDNDNTFNLGSSGRRWNTVYAGEFNGTATSARYADLAELYAADSDYESGTVVVFGGDAEVTQTDCKGDTRVAGVVSTNPAHLMNSDLVADHPVAVALQGRVPCKVLSRVEKGDLLVTSAVPGYAVVDNEGMSGTVIGKALEHKEDLGKGIIEVVVGRV